MKMLIAFYPLRLKDVLSLQCCYTQTLTGNQLNAMTSVKHALNARKMPFECTAHSCLYMYIVLLFILLYVLFATYNTPQPSTAFVCVLLPNAGLRVYVLAPIVECIVHIIKYNAQSCLCLPLPDALMFIYLSGI